MIPEPDPLAATARERPSTVAVVVPEGGKQVRYAALDERVGRLAGWFRELGVSTGDRIVLLGDHEVTTISAIHAAWRLGATIVPVDPELSMGRRRRRCELIDPAVRIGTSRPVDDDVISVPEVTDRPDAPASVPGLRADDTACILFTSGTTGSPRPVRLTARNLVTSAIASERRLGILPADRWLVPLAPYHMGGFAPVVRTALAGTGIILTETGSAAFTAAIENHGATIVSLVPPLLKRALEDGVPLDRLRVVLVGGDRTAPALVERSLERDVPIHVTWGMTEAASQITTATPAQLREDPTTVGRPLRYSTVSVDGDELLVDGPTISPGYVGETDDDRFTAAGMLRTGDRGYLEDGMVEVTGRVNDRIVTGGTTVDPRYVERLLRDHPAISAASVVGVPDEEWGQLVCALVAPTEPPDLGSFLEDRLRSAERPRRLEAVDALPRTPSGTVDRKAVERHFTVDRGA